ncbi:hypothetical protein [Oceanobacter mangrovi]|uniref:hypothetical protein n=1 Tax=Oceanobacter mangrovi TaxID=2862510 RepID=UPI001C8EB2E0|nr:hypothetical protein [Oceanobacter mangrovi]
MKLITAWFLMLVVSMPAFAAGERSFGAFELLGKEWFVVSLSDVEAAKGVVHDGDRLEFKVAEQEISQRRFQTLWTDALSSSGADIQLHRFGTDMKTFFGAIKGPLEQGDYLALERQGKVAVLTINHYEHAILSGEFMDMVVAALTDRIAPIPVLRQGLTNEISQLDRRKLERRFTNEDVSLGRVNQTARWLRYDNDNSSVSQL